MINATCPKHGGARGFTNVMMTKVGGTITLDPHATVTIKPRPAGPQPKRQRHKPVAVSADAVYVGGAGLSIAGSRRVRPGGRVARHTEEKVTRSGSARQPLRET